MLKYILLAILIAPLMSCNQSINDISKDLYIDSLNHNTNDSTIIICSMPSPFQLSNLLKEENKEYNDKIIIDSYSKDYKSLSYSKKAIVLGILSVDLSYSIIYKKQQNTLNYFSKIKSLADDLGIIGAFNPTLIKRVEKNIDNTDSLNYITITSFNDINEYFNINNRQETAILVLIGGLIEGIYLSSSIAMINNTKKNNEIISKNTFYIENAIKLIDIKKTKNNEIITLYNDLVLLNKNLKSFEYDENELKNIFLNSTEVRKKYIY